MNIIFHLNTYIYNKAIVINLIFIKIFKNKILSKISILKSKNKNKKK